jgi:hypothetical protein
MNLPVETIRRVHGQRGTELAIDTNGADAIVQRLASRRRERGDGEHVRRLIHRDDADRDCLIGRVVIAHHLQGGPIEHCETVGLRIAPRVPGAESPHVLRSQC